MAQQHYVESEPDARRREHLILFILAAVQFITIVDFMIVMPLGPQFMRTLAIGPEQFALIVSSYTFAAGIAGLVASSIVDRFPRRTIFMVLYAGFLLGTLFCAIAPNYLLLIAARVATGAFGGILGGLSMTIVGDVFPDERRGRATGILMSGFAVASVAGVPLGLYLGTNHGWHVPFWALVVGGVPFLLLTPQVMPKLDGHLGRAHAHPLRSIVEMFSRRNHLRAFALTVALMLGSFSVFPFVSAYFVKNVGLTEDELPLLYVLGGALTLVAAPIVGRLADRFGKLKVYRIVAPLAAAMLLAITNLPPVPTWIAVVVFGSLMVSNIGRSIPAMAMITGSVEPRLRGGFMSANSAVQHIAAGVATSLGGAIVKQTPDGRLERFGLVGVMAAAATLATLWLAGRVRSAEIAPAKAEDLSLAAAAEASVDSGEAMVAAVGGDRPAASQPATTRT
jgi:DHA1 family inner membrane transport protein